MVVIQCWTSSWNDVLPCQQGKFLALVYYELLQAIKEKVLVFLFTRVFSRVSEPPVTPAFHAQLCFKGWELIRTDCVQQSQYESKISQYEAAHWLLATVLDPSCAVSYWRVRKWWKQSSGRSCLLGFSQVLYRKREKKPAGAFPCCIVLNFQTKDRHVVQHLTPLFGARCHQNMDGRNSRNVVTYFACT